MKLLCPVSNTITSGIILSDPHLAQVVFIIFILSLLETVNTLLCHGCQWANAFRLSRATSELYLTSISRGKKLNSILFLGRRLESVVSGSWEYKTHFITEETVTFLKTC
jgi:hypothetical protein